MRQISRERLRSGEDNRELTCDDGQQETYEIIARCDGNKPASGSPDYLPNRRFHHWHPSTDFPLLSRELAQADKTS
jgi:hypothetical protein